ncbi:phage tail domain-containing protein [Paenibacillus elgii]|uniref:phage tail domain-containing protein n=1 Tax=Paenibacillus elgii TaxID=189691 RepID=UPI002040C1F2|nr:phage tail domain-containing protein [Paenibacillus elgii]MCM3274159.1 phage tail family protein [Paenibacillus elgii]
MTTWAGLTGFTGFRVSPDFPLSLDGDGALSKISWNATTPIGTSVKVETNVSFNNGLDWKGWREATNGGNIPDIHPTTSLKSAIIKYRITEETNEKGKTPIFHDVSFYFEPVLVVDNKGDVNLKPEIWITKVGNGDFSLINTSNANDEFKFTSLIDGEVVYVHNENEDIETSLSATYRYKNFNDHYLTLPYGENVFRVIGNAKLKFRYSYKTLQG